MATNDYGICNLALTLVKQTTFLESLTAETSTAKLCNLYYDEARRTLLKSFRWSFSIGRATLVLASGTPDWGYGKHFTLPSDNLQILRTDDLDNAYRVEGNLLLTDETAVKVKYIKDITSVASFTQHFVEMLAASIALKLVPNLITSTWKSKHLIETITSKYAMHLDFAIKSGDIEDYAENVRHTNAKEWSWVTIRN